MKQFLEELQTKSKVPSNWKDFHNEVCRLLKIEVSISFINGKTKFDYNLYLLSETVIGIKPNIQIFLFLTQFLSAILEKFNTRYNLKSEDVI